MLQLNAAGQAQWLNLPAGLVRQAAPAACCCISPGVRGHCIDPNGERLWLAAEQRRRGLTVLHKKATSWRCTGGCVLISESGVEPGPEALGSAPVPRDFSGLAYFGGKTLHPRAPGPTRICRRTLSNGEVERCWSFAGEALTEPRRYSAHLRHGRSPVGGQGRRPGSRRQWQPDPRRWREPPDRLALQAAQGRWSARQ